jgi:hypothetical protein
MWVYPLARWLLQNNMGELYELLHYGACVHERLHFSIFF